MSKGKSPSVSVVIPAYNYGPFLGEAIESALAQTYQPLEVIVIDDGSTDNTPEVAASYGSRIRFVRTPNKGVSAARNAGIEISKGDLIAFVDADDRWLPNKLEIQIPHFLSDPAVGLVHAGNRVFDNETAATLCEPPVDSTASLHDLLKCCAVSASAVVVPRRIFKETGGFDERLAGGEDWDMWLRIAAGYKVISHREVLVEVRSHGKGLGSNNALRMFRDCMTVLQKARSIHPGCPQCASAIRSAQRQMRKEYYAKVSAAARACLRDGDYLRGWRWRLVSVWRYPQIVFHAPAILWNRVRTMMARSSPGRNSSTLKC